LYRLQSTVIEVISRQFSFSQLSSAENKRKISEFEKILQQYSIALYQQSRQYNYITDLEHFIFASSDSSAESEQIAGAESINQLLQKIYSYNYVYNYLIKTNKQTFHDRLAATVETLFEISE